MPDWREFLRYVLVGGINTAVCYAIYLVLLLFVHHNIAYVVDYAFGIVFSYFLQLKFVFGGKGSLRKFLAFPSVYVVQFLVGLLTLNTVVVFFDVPPEYALLFAIVVPLPITFLMSRAILRAKATEAS